MKKLTLLMACLLAGGAYAQKDDSATKAEKFHIGVGTIYHFETYGAEILLGGRHLKITKISRHSDARYGAILSPYAGVRKFFSDSIDRRFGGPCAGLALNVYMETARNLFAEIDMDAKTVFAGGKARTIPGFTVGFRYLLEGFKSSGHDPFEPWNENNSARERTFRMGISCGVGPDLTKESDLRIHLKVFIYL